MGMMTHLTAMLVAFRKDDCNDPALKPATSVEKEYLFGSAVQSLSNPVSRTYRIVSTYFDGGMGGGIIIRSCCFNSGEFMTCVNDSI